MEDCRPRRLPGQSRTQAALLRILAGLLPADAGEVVQQIRGTLSEAYDASVATSVRVCFEQSPSAVRVFGCLLRWVMPR